VKDFDFLSKFLVLEALGLRIRVEEDPEAMVAYSPTAATYHTPLPALPQHRVLDTPGFIQVV
jgi:hypothetical protein